MFWSVSGDIYIYKVAASLVSIIVAIYYVRFKLLLGDITVCVQVVISEVLLCFIIRRYIIIQLCFNIS